MFKKVSRNSTRACVLTLLMLLLVTLLSNACAGQTVQPEVTRAIVEATPTAEPSGRGAGDTLRLLYWEAPDILNPHLTASTKDQEASRIVYEPLASFDKDGNLVPFLAAEIPSLENGGVAADGKSVTWKLKQGIQWSDGEPFTADDVRFTYEFIVKPEVNSASVAFYDAVASVEVIDDYIVKVNFKDVNPAWALPFVGIQGMIIPRHIFESYNGPNAREAPANTLPVGTGPYRVLPPGIKPQEVLFLGTDLIQTVKIVYEPNPFFREADKPFFSRVELKGGGVVNEAARAVLQAGEVDFAYNLQLEPDVLAKLEEGGKGKVVANFQARVEQIALNRTDPNRETKDGELSSLQFPHPFFSDRKVRQAFAYAIDREAIASLYGSTGRPTSNNLVAPAIYYSPNTFYEFNPEKARALLDEAGWIDTDGDGVREKDGIKLKVVSQAAVSSLLRQSQEIVKENLGAIGVEVEVNLVDAGVYYGDPSTNPNSVLRFQADLQEFDISADSPDPGPYMQYWTCDQIPQKANDWLAGLNLGRWCNPAYDALLKQANAELDPEKRRQLFIEMNDMLIEDVALISLVHLAQISGISDTIEGLDSTPWDANLWDIKDWRRKSP